MTGYTVYDACGKMISNWTTRKNAVSAGIALKKRGEIGHYVVNEKNAELIWGGK